MSSAGLTDDVIALDSDSSDGGAHTRADNEPCSLSKIPVPRRGARARQVLKERNNDNRSSVMSSAGLTDDVVTLDSDSSDGGARARAENEPCSLSKIPVPRRGARARQVLKERSDDNRDEIVLRTGVVKSRKVALDVAPRRKARSRRRALTFVQESENEMEEEFQAREEPEAGEAKENEEQEQEEERDDEDSETSGGGEAGIVSDGEDEDGDSSEEDDDYIALRSKGRSARGAATTSSLRNQSTLRDLASDNDSYQSNSESDSTADLDDVSDDDEEELARRPKPQRRLAARARTARPATDESEENDEISPADRQARLDELLEQSARISEELADAIDMNRQKREPGTATDARNAPSGTGKVGHSVTGDGCPERDVVDEEALLVKQLPIAPGYALQPHQEEGVKWILRLDKSGHNGILADEMGLGKTVQALAALASMIDKGKRGPHLVIAPLAVAHHWQTEAACWFPDVMKVHVHSGSAPGRFERLEEALCEDDWDVFVTTHELALRDFFTPLRSLAASSAAFSSTIRRLRKIEFEYLVVDEAHRLKNSKSRLTCALRNYKRAGRRILLTGTPLSNKLEELWALLNVLNPAIFGNAETFMSWFASPFKGGQNLSNAEKAVIVARMHTVLRPFFRRRVRADVCKDFMSAEEVIVRCPASPLQIALQQYVRGSRGKGMVTQNRDVIWSLRKVCNHPWTFSDAFVPLEGDNHMQEMVRVSGKLLFLHYALPRLLAGGHRVLLFCQMTHMLDIIDDMLDEMSIDHFCLDGRTPGEDRPDLIANFNREGSQTNVFLISTRAGGMGINLQTADTVILVESDWNPAADLQAVSRVQRIGQTKPVHVMRLVTHRQIDEVIIERARKKKETEAIAVGAGKFSTGTDFRKDMHQKDIAKLLDDLDATAPAFGNHGGHMEVIHGKPADSLSISEGNARCEETLSYVSDWDKLILRQGEASLPLLEDHLVLSIATGAASVPEWLTCSGPDAGFVQAGLNAYGTIAAYQAVQEAKHAESLYAGQSKNKRLSRKARIAASLAELSDSGSEQATRGESDSDEDQQSRAREKDGALGTMVANDDSDTYTPSEDNEEESCEEICSDPNAAGDATNLHHLLAACDLR